MTKLELLNEDEKVMHVLTADGNNNYERPLVIKYGGDHFVYHDSYSLDPDDDHQCVQFIIAEVWEPK